MKSRTFIYSLKADYPISVGIIGDSNPSINLTNASTTGGDLYLTNDIKNDVGAKLNITARGGKIEQAEGTKISTDNIKLTARTGIKNIDVTNHLTDDLKLNAQSTTGDIDINVSGGIRENQKLAGNFTVNALNSSYGEVKLTAQGDIKQTISGAAFNAQNIKLDSANGSINLQIASDNQAGAELSAISAAAQGDIKLVKNDNADFLIGSIVSTQGDVELKANGKFVDALDKVRDNADTEESDLVKSWIDMGLIAGTDDYKGAYLNRLETDRDNYKADVTEQFDAYTILKTAYDGAVESYNELKKRTEDAKPEEIDRLELLSNKFGKYETADAYLAEDSDYQTLVSTVANPQYKWTADELLSGIRSAIVNKEEGTASDVTKLKDANITAHNVTLTGAGVGTNSKEKLSALANVEAADVKVNLALDKDDKPVVQTVTQVNYNYDNESGYYIGKAGNYVRYRKDADGNLLKYSYKKDGDNFAQVGEAGIFNAATSVANVIGKDLVLVGGNGAIGSQEKPFAVQLTGDLLNARANEEINLSKVGADNFRISAIYSPKAIRITNNGGGIIEHSSRFDDIAAAYINTPGEITLTGSAGTANNPILIRPHETTALNLRGDGDFYVKGLNTGTVNLNDLSGTVDISSEGSIKQTADGVNGLTALTVAASGDVILDGNNKLDAINLGAIGGTITSDAQINQRGDIALEGSVNVSTLSLTSKSGNITSTGGLRATKEIKISTATFTHEGEIHADKLTLAIDNGVKIDNARNAFNSLEIASRDGNAINGSINVAITADNFASTIKNDVTGDVTLTNTKNGGLLSFGNGETINIGGNFSANSAGNFDYDATLTVGKEIYIKSVNSGVLTLGDVVGEFMSASSDGSIAQADGKKLNLTNKLEVSATNDTTLVSDNALTLNGNIESENISLTAGTNLTSDKASVLKANKNISLKADDVKLAGKVETAYKEMTSDKVEDVEKFIDEMPTISVTTNKGLDMHMDIETDNGSIDIAGKIATLDGDITIDDTADTLKATDTIRIELEHGDLYLNLAQSKGVAILTDDDSKKSSVNTIISDSVTVDRNIVTVGKILPYRSTLAPSKGTSTTRSYGYSNSYGNSFTNNLASNRSSSATLGTTLTRSGSGLTTTYWQNTSSPSSTVSAVPDYSFSEFDSETNDVSYMLTRNYFEVRFVPTWLEKEFMDVDFDYSFDNFGIRNATEDELTIN